VNEQDIELLESYLDGSLEAGAAEGVRARLDAEAGLRAGLDELRAEREARRGYFLAQEPEPAALERFLARVNEAIREAEMPVERPARRLVPVWLRPAKYAVAAAACIALGLLIRPMVESKPAGKQLANDPNTNRTVDVRPVAMYEVTLRDQAGVVIAVQRFESMEKAQEFAGDLSRWQSRSERLAAGKFVVTADRF